MPLVRSVRALALVVVFTTLLVPALAWGQHPSEVVGFNGPPIDDPATSQEMFKIPEWSGSTVNYVLANPPNTFDNNAAYRASGFGMEGVAAMNVFFRWVDTNDPDAWVRLTTFGGPERPNPGLDTRGKIRFNILNKSELFQGHVGLCIGIRETGEVVPQLADGGTSGDIEWVGVDPTPNGITAGADMIVDTTAHANDVQVYAPGTDIGSNGLGLPSGTAVIEPGVDGVLDTVATTNDDEIRFGYFISSDGLRTPIPALIVQVENNFQEFEIDLATGDITHSWDHDNNAGTPYQTTVIDGGIAGMTGNGILDAANDRGTLEHLAFTNVTSDIAVLIDVGIDALQFEATVADPLTPPTVVAPIINDDVLISVTDLLLTADEVDLYRDAVLVETKNIVSTNGVTFDLGTNGAVTDEAFTAIQRDLDSGQTSPESAPVIVLAAPSPYTFSFVLDEDGDGSCSFDPPGGWEHVGVSAVDTAGAFRYPRGVNIFTDNAQWQTIDIALDDPSIVIQWLGGNGTIDPSPTGLYTIDSMWLTLAPGAPTGPNEMFIDTIELLDASDNVLETIHDMEDGINYLSQVRGQSSTTPTSTALSTLTSFDGLTSHRVEWTYPSATDEAVGLYHNIGFQCGTSPQFSDAGVTIRFHLLARSAPLNAEPLPVVTGPIVSLIGGDQTQVRVEHEGTATSVSLYINGAEIAVEGAPTGTETDFSGLTLVAGDSVSATQTLPGRATSDFAYPRGVAAAPVPPVVESPLAPGLLTVTVNGAYDTVFATASLITVNVNDGAEIATGVPIGGTAVVNLTTALVTGFTVKAKQTVNGRESAYSAEVVVGYLAPVIYAAPPPGNVDVRVQELVPTADSVTVRVNDTTDFTLAITPGAAFADVPVTGLITGDSIVAFQSVGAVDSVATLPETVTTGTTTVILCDDFEYDQVTYEATWLTSAAPRPTLSTDRNGTTAGEGGGTQSILNDGNIGRVEQNIANLVPTATDPLVWNVDIYDTVGPGGASHNQFAQLNGQVADFFFQHVGISNLASDIDYYQYRAVGNGGPNWIDLDQHDGPQRSVGWHNFTVVHKGDFVDVYVDGLLSAKNVALTTETFLDRARIGPGVNNIQPGYYDDYCIETGPVRFGEVPVAPPGKPTIAAPITDGDEALTVTGVDLDVTLVEVRDESLVLLGSYSGVIDPSGEVPIALNRSLVHLELITATVTDPGGSTSSDPLEVGVGNGDVLICLGIRETGDAGPLGSPGGTSGSIEWIEATGVVNGAPQGIAVSPSSIWQTLVFDPASLDIAAFTGNGVIDGTRGTLEHLAVTVNAASGSRSSGPYRMYIDNVVNVGAGAGGSDFEITGFEGFALGDEVLFQEPTNSGSTAGDLAPLPSASEASDHYGNPGQSELLVWFWKDTTDQRWARITTSSANNLPQPIIDLTKRIRMDILLLPECGTVKGDMDGDCDIGLDDVDAFETCMSGPVTSADLTCVCADFNNNGRVDLGDFAAVQRNYSDGVAIPGCTP